MAAALLPAYLSADCGRVSNPTLRLPLNIEHLDVLYPLAGGCDYTKVV